MPTPRAVTFIIAAIVLYLFANQTQVGWLYVVSALMAGSVLAAGWLGRAALRGLAGERRIDRIEMHEGDAVAVRLALQKQQHGGASHVRLTETCPLAPPNSAQRSVTMFIPSLPAKTAVQFEYEVVVDRRGAHEFPALDLATRAPFGFFRRSRKLPVLTRVLVYPEVRPLRRLDLLDRRVTPQMTRQRAGVGYEAIGVRPYRAGDSPRHIHWRSVARTGTLISKEFADEAQPGLSLLLDIYRHPCPVAYSKHTPFEWAVKAAASIGEYARRKGYPLHIVADDEALAVPTGPVTWSALLQYLARVQPNGAQRLARLIDRSSVQSFAAAILPWPDPVLVEALIDLRRRGIETLAVVLDPESFPAGGPSTSLRTSPSARPFANQLAAAGLDVRLLRFGDDWAGQIDQRQSF